MKSTESLTQEEIDRLLCGISHGGFVDSIEKIHSPEDLGRALFLALGAGTKSRGMFRGPNLLMDRHAMQEAHLRASVSEPESITRIGDIEIFPVNVCPHCGARLADSDVTAWFRDSMPTPQFIAQHPGLSRFNMERLWKKEVETLPCASCGQQFQPSTVVTRHDDGIAIPSYCRYQTIAHLQSWFDTRTSRGLSLFSTATRTVAVTSEATRFYWDIFLNPVFRGIETCPGDIMANILRYTPYRDIVRFTAREKGLHVFDGQDFTALYRQEMAFGR